MKKKFHKNITMERLIIFWKNNAEYLTTKLGIDETEVEGVDSIIVEEIETVL